jgi:hypothetical protein
VFLLIRFALREDLERAFAFGVIKDIGGQHQTVGASAADEVIEDAPHASDAPTMATSSLAGVKGSSRAAKLSTGGGTRPRRYICKSLLVKIYAA